MKKMLLIYILLIVILGGFAIFKAGYIKFPNFGFGNGNKTPYAMVNNAKIKLILAKKESDQETGLSNRNSLAQDQGMLFVFERKDYYQFWMKNMKFPIDMIYINDNKVVYVFDDVKPPTITKNVAGMTIYRPNDPANFVLEVNSGIAKKYNIKPGTTINLYNVE